MARAFTDKELQICAQLGYFSFSRDMEHVTLGQLFKEPDIERTTINNALKSLLDKRDRGTISSDEFDIYMDCARKYLASQLEVLGIAKKEDKKILIVRYTER